MKKLFILLVASLLVTATANSDISVSQNLSRNKIAFEDSVLFEVKIVWDGHQARYLFEKPLAPTVDRLSVGSVSSSVSSVGVGGSEQTTKTFKFSLHPNASGAGYIAPISISYIIWPDSLPGELHTEAMTVQIAEPLPVSLESDSAIPLWMLVTVILLGGGTAAFFIYRSKTSSSVNDQPDTKEQFLIDLERIKKDAGGDFKRFQNGLWRILREYIRNKVGIDPEKYNDSKLTKVLIDAGIDNGEAGRLAVWYMKARQDKFKPVKTEPGDLVRLETEIRNLFEKK